MVDETSQRLFISLWGQASVQVIDLKSGTLQGRWETEVRFDTERLCTRGDGKCWFRIEVRR